MDMRVLCITPKINAPVTINVQQPMEFLKANGLADYTIREDADVAVRDIHAHDVILFFRPIYPSILKYAYYSKYLGKTVIFGADDNFYELEYSEYAAPMDPKSLEAHSLFIKNADLVLVYSRPMLERALTLNPNSAMLTPGINFSLVRGHAPKGDGRVRIVYPTSRSRDTLSGLFFPAARKILTEYGTDVEMNFWGFIPDEFRGMANVRMISYVDYAPYLDRLSSDGFDIGLAPLLDDPFHTSKTNTKFRDYGACRVAGVYSNVSPYSDCVEDGKTGLLAENTAESYYGAIKRLVEDAGLRESIKDAAYKVVRDSYDLEKSALEFYEKIKAADSKARRRKTRVPRLSDLLFDISEPADGLAAYPEYEKLFRGRRPYRISLNFIKRFIERCRALLSLFLFKKTRLNRVEVFLRKRCVKPLTGFIRRGGLHKSG